ncbi:MAG: hypothetical protein AAFR20_03765 [Pseudomonadota bacterium]
MKKEILGSVMQMNRRDCAGACVALSARATKRGKTRKNGLQTTTAMALAAALGFSFAGPGLGASAAAAPADSIDSDTAFIIAAQNAYGTSVPAVDAEAPRKTSPWLIGAGMALILGALVKLIGANRVMNLAAEAGPALQKTAETLAEAPKAAARAMGAAMTTPLRYLMLIGGLAMIGFTGISFFDLEWGAGILTGIGMTAVTWAGTARFGGFFRRIRVPVRVNTPAQSQHPRGEQAAKARRETR